MNTHNQPTNQDLEYMRLALSLAAKGRGHTAPNPMVGAVIVKDGRIIGSGYHEKYGSPHAERNALANCTLDPSGATIYVTLEPCCHHGKQPPCTDALIAAGIARVVIGSPDPNPLVAGKGIEILRRHNVEVITGILQEECDRLNREFFHYITTGTPYVTMKYAMTVDGKTAAYTGAARWISGEESRRHTHRERSFAGAIMVGVGTALADDPLLTCRLPDGRNPMRVICDSRLRTPLSSRLVQTTDEAATVIATCTTDKNKIAPYIQAGCQVWILPPKDGQVDLTALMKRLGGEKISSVILEGGAALNWSALNAGIVNRVQIYIAPKLLGGAAAKSPIGGQGFPHPNQALKLTDCAIIRLGDDLLIESEIKGEIESEVQPCSQA